MRWSYKTVHFSLKKDGLLGSAFIDEVEIEYSLNEYGHAGWELVSFMEVNDGLIAIFKQPLSREITAVDTAIQNEEEAAVENPPVTERASVPTQEEDSAAVQSPSEKVAFEEAESTEDDVGSIRIF